MPAASSASSSTRPAGPTNGLPAMSSLSPGCSPTKMTFAVRPLCQELAIDYGWIKEGSPTSPTVPNQRRRRRRGLASLFDSRRQPPDEPVVAEPILRRLSPPEQQMVEAADIFNSSD